VSLSLLFGQPPPPPALLLLQIQSNALGALEALDQGIAQRVYEEGCITGNRINGLCDGVTGDWYVKFDTFHPAVDMGLPITRVISRITLQASQQGPSQPVIHPASQPLRPSGAAAAAAGS
jgi:hypothetical protein